MPDSRFPVQGHTEENENGSLRRVPSMTVPWIVGEIAYNEYSRLYGKQQSLKRLAERAGFGQGEMDGLFPQWRRLTAMLDGVDTPKDTKPKP